MGFIQFIAIIVYFHAPTIMGIFVQGMYAPAFTPFDDKGMVDDSNLVDFAKYISERGVKGIYVAGSAGEGSNISVKELKLLLRKWVQIAKEHKLRVVANIGAGSLGDMISLAKYCECLKVDVICMMPTLYFKPKTVEQASQLLEAVSKAAPSIPIQYNHYVEFTDVDLNMAELFAMATKRIPNFIGMVCDLQTAVQISAANTLKYPQSLCIGGYGQITAAAFLGYRCFVTVAINVYPNLVVKAIEYGKAGNSSMAIKAQTALNRIADRISKEGTLITGHKAAMEIYAGIKVGDARIPLQPLSDEAKMNVKAVTDTIDGVVKRC